MSSEEKSTRGRIAIRLVQPRPALDLLDAADHVAPRVDAVQPGRHRRGRRPPRPTGSTRTPCAAARPLRRQSTTPPAPLRSMNAPAPALRSMISCTLAACAAGSSIPGRPRQAATAPPCRGGRRRSTPLSMVTSGRRPPGRRPSPAPPSSPAVPCAAAAAVARVAGAAGLGVGVLELDAEAIELQLQCSAPTVPRVPRSCPMPRSPCVTRP